MPDSYSALIKDELLREEADFSSLRGRSISVLTAAGALVTLISAVVAAASGAAELALPTGARIAVVLSLVAFIVAAVLTLIINKPRDLVRPDVADLVDLAGQRWADEHAAQNTAALQVKEIEALRIANKSCAQLLNEAIILEVLGIGLIGVSAAITVLALP